VRLSVGFVRLKHTLFAAYLDVSMFGWDENIMETFYM